MSRSLLLVLSFGLVSCASDSDEGSRSDSADAAPGDDTPARDNGPEPAQHDSGAAEVEPTQNPVDPDAGGPAEPEPTDEEQETETDFGSCETPLVVESCYVENTDRPGTALCSEYYAPGQAALFCEQQDIVTEPCPRGDDLYGICVGGISSYFYADADNEDLWVAAGSGCTLNMGTWCGP